MRRTASSARVSRLSVSYDYGLIMQNADTYTFLISNLVAKAPDLNLGKKISYYATFNFWKTQNMFEAY